MEGGEPCCFHHFRIGLRWLDVAESRMTLIVQQAVRVAQSSGKDDDGARRWWIDMHETRAHWRVPADEELSDG